MDTVRADHTSFGGYARPTTPRLAEIGMQGAIFERAYSSAPWTLPSHASMFTGRPANELSTTWSRPLDGTHPTLSETLARNGYATAGFVANTRYCAASTGLARGFAHYEDFDVTPGEIFECLPLYRTAVKFEPLKNAIGALRVGRKTATDVNAEFLDWCDGRPDRPFFAFLNYFDAHDPYAPPEPFEGRFSDSPPYPNEPPNTASEVSGEQMDRLIAAYDGGIATVDDAIGRLLDELDRRGILQNTIVVVVADHGEEFGEHGWMLHGFTAYHTAIHVPFVIWSPTAVPSGVRVSEPVTLVDLPATVLELAGIADHGGIAGHSLARHLRGSDGPPEGSRVVSEVFSIAAPSRPEQRIRSLVLDDRQYIRYENGTEEVFDLAADPNGLSNIMQRTGDEIVRLRQTLDDAVATTK